MQPVPPAHFSTLEYLWQQYATQPRQLAFRAETLAAWHAWRDALRARLLECLGGLPAERGELAPRVVDVSERENYRQEKIYFYSEPGVAVPCYVLTPRDVPPPYRPVIALHGHGSDGAELLVGHAKDRAARANLRAYNYDYARQLVRHGFMVFAPVQRAFGERLERAPAFRVGVGARAKSCEMVNSVGLLFGKALAGLRVWDVMRTIDYIRTRAEPLTEKIACLGLSGGGSVTLYTAALDERIRLAVVAGAFCTYRASIMSIVHCPDNYVPGILRYAELADVAGLIAPRPLLIEHGTQDPIFPIAGVRQAYRELQRVYALVGRAEDLAKDFFPGGHRFGGRKTFAWLDRAFARA